MIEVAIARLDDLDEHAFQRIRAQLPIERRRKGDRYHRQRDRHASAVAFALLQHLWRRRFTAPLPPVVTGAFGKPRFAADQGLYFNLSHDAAFCACALAPVPVGIDVQSRIPFSEGLFARIAAPGEHRLRERLRAADDLSPLWTRKEAVVKRTGRGLSTPLRRVDTLAEPDLLTLSCNENDLRVSISAEGLGRDRRSRLRIDWIRPGTDLVAEFAPGTAALERSDMVLAEGPAHGTAASLERSGRK